MPVNNLINNATHHNVKHTTFTYLPSVVQTWDFRTNTPNGIRRMDVTDKLVVYFARIVLLDGTPCCFDGQKTLLINTNNDGYQRLTFEQFCQWVNDRIYYSKKTYDNSDKKPATRLETTFAALKSQQKSLNSLYYGK